MEDTKEKFDIHVLLQIASKMEDTKEKFDIHVLLQIASKIEKERIRAVQKDLDKDVIDMMGEEISALKLAYKELVSFRTIKELLK